MARGMYRRPRHISTNAFGVAKARLLSLTDRLKPVRGYLKRDPALAVAVFLVAGFVVVALLGNVMWSKDPLAVDVGAALEPPSTDHPLGTDGAGRDILARVIAGARISLTAALIVVVLGGIVGGSIGMIAGVTRATDGILMRSMDALLAFPPLILAMAVTLGLGVGLSSATIGIAISSVPYYARLMRSEVLKTRSLPHVEAAVAVGASRKRILLRHILPHASSTMLVQAAALFGVAILSLAGLGFVGLGAQIPTPEWGTMITDGLQYTLTGQWWVAVMPGMGILVAVLTANLLADRLQDVLVGRHG